jgi:TolB-like protein/DNA-binding winged helix-turn-helix (wHTH) protein/Tfp pilus assembly protein PilF
MIRLQRGKSFAAYNRRQDVLTAQMNFSLPTRIRFGLFEIDIRSGELRRKGSKVNLQAQPFQALVLLLERQGDVVTREELSKRLWPANTFVDFDRGLNKAINKVRAALGDNAEKPRYIETLPQRGYRFIASLSPSDSHTASPRDEPTQLLGPVYALEKTPTTPRSPDLVWAVVANESEEMIKRGSSFDSMFLDSIAVLPFENTGGEPDMEYLSDGITASIINNLSQIHALRVVPRTTASRYKGKLGDLAQVGRELRVRVVLTGRIFQRGDALSINVELIDPAHESQLWGAHFNGNSDDILSIQTEIATRVTSKLEVRLNNEEKRQLAKRPTASREAYHLLLKSLFWANKWTPDGVRKGVDYARQAIDVDPVYAEAWTALAYLFVLIGFFGDAPPAEIFSRAKAAAAKALEIDDSQSDAHATLAYVQMVYDRDWHSARKGLVRAIELGPTLANGHWVYSHWYLTQGLYLESMTEAKIALDLDPLSVQFNYQVGAIYFFSRQYDRAIEQLRATNELDPLFAPSRQLLAASYAQNGMRSKAIAEVKKGVELARNNSHSKALWGIIGAMSGNMVEARQSLEQLKRESKPPNFSFAYQCASLHALLGETDDAFTCLGLARHGHSVQLAYVAIAQELDSLHEDPRFREMLLDMGLPIAIPKTSSR